MLDQLRESLRRVSSPERAAVSARFFKTGPGEYGEGDKFLGATVPDVRKLVRDGQALKPRELRALLTSEWHEERLLGLLILVRQFERGDEKTREEVYHYYLRHTRHINSWDLVDTSAPNIVGAHLAKRSRAPLRQLAKSSSLWERRIAMLATFYFIRRDEFGDGLQIAEMLIGDREDLIHKAVGWMLREIGSRDRATLEKFLEKHASVMPRVMLAYAIEKFPQAARKEWLARRSNARGRKSLSE